MQTKVRIKRKAECRNKKEKKDIKYNIFYETVTNTVEDEQLFTN